MACTQAPLTLLRVKRARTHAALDAVHIRLPKRARTTTQDVYTDTRLFRRLPAAADIATLGPARVVDIDPSVLRRSVPKDGEKRDWGREKDSVENWDGVREGKVDADESSDAGDKTADTGCTDATEVEREGTILYNGVPLEREFLDDQVMYDIFAEERAETRARVELLEGSGGNVAWVTGDDLPVFDWDSESEEADESDEERSMDYPSTPEQSDFSDGGGNEDEDGWRRRFCGSEGETEDGYDGFDEEEEEEEEEEDGDCFDYEA